VTSARRGHELSKPSLTDARWRAERIGPTINAAPHRRQAHTAPGSNRRCHGCGSGAGEATKRGAGQERPREGDARRSTGVGEKPRLPDAHEATGQDVLHETLEKLPWPRASSCGADRHGRSPQRYMIGPALSRCVELGYPALRAQGSEYRTSSLPSEPELTEVMSVWRYAQRCQS
jgi:hypothetical protein